MLIPAPSKFPNPIYFYLQEKGKASEGEAGSNRGPIGQKTEKTENTVKVKQIVFILKLGGFMGCPGGGQERNFL